MPRSSCSIEDLVRLHGAFVWRSVRRLGVEVGDVDDVTQQVFLRARERLGEVDAGAERGFLFRLALGFASNERRAHRRRRERGGLDPEIVAGLSARVDDRLEKRQLLETLLEPLDLELRAVLVLAEVEEMSAPEIAALLEIPVGTVASRLRRAREEVQASLRRHRARTAPGAPARDGSTR